MREASTCLKPKHNLHVANNTADYLEHLFHEALFIADPHSATTTVDSAVHKQASETSAAAEGEARIPLPKLYANVPSILLPNPLEKRCTEILPASKLSPQSFLRISATSSQPSAIIIPSMTSPYSLPCLPSTPHLPHEACYECTNFMCLDRVGPSSPRERYSTVESVSPSGRNRDAPPFPNGIVHPLCRRCGQASLRVVAVRTRVWSCWACGEVVRLGTRKLCTKCRYGRDSACRVEWGEWVRSLGMAYW